MFKAKLDEVTKVMSLRSSVLSEYFYLLMTNHNIKSIRNGMKVLIFYCFCEIISTHIAEPGAVFRPLLALVSFCLYFLMFACTVNIQQTTIMVRLASIMVVMSMTYTVLVGTDPHEIMETNYSLSIITILMMYTLFRLKFLVTMLLSIIYILLFVSIGNYRMKYIDKLNISSVHLIPLRRIRVFSTKISSKPQYIFGQCILFFIAYLAGLYLRFFNSIRRKSAFLKLAQNAEAKMKTNSAQKVQIHWIEAIMPAAVKDEFQNSIRKSDMFNLIYCRNFENVSILFADIVGFTAMSSNKTAAQLVYLLNDLYNRFDEHGKDTNCEKLGTLGDCYYCVAGCPIPRVDHSVCCVEMGLGMCRLIQRFNRDHKEKVNMRVGVHSGRVIAAIIGNHRFRFDVFSNDVIVANALESSGEPGHVHISEDTYKLVRHAYQFREGDSLEIKKEQPFGLSGMVQRIVPIRTYFIKPKRQKQHHHQIGDQNILDNLRNSASPSTHQNQHNQKENKNSNQQNKGFNKRLSVNAETRHIIINPVQANSLFQRRDEKMQEDLDLIRSLQKDPEKPVEFFQNPPLDPFTLSFLDKEIEYHYMFHTTDQVENIRIESIKIALLIDCIASLVYTTFIVIASVTMIPKYDTTGHRSKIVYSTAVLTTLISSFISLIYRSEIQNTYIRHLYDIFSHPLCRLLLSVYISSIPNLFVITIYDPNQLLKNYHYTSAYFSLTLFALIGNCLFTSSYSLIKQIFTLIFTAIPMYLFLWQQINTDTSDLFSSCMKYLQNEELLVLNRLQFNFCFQLIHICLLIYYLTRENEKTIRINFYATREAEIRYAEATRAKKIAESLLYNIIPKHVFSQIAGGKWNDQKEITFSYAHAIPNAGVVFACISNFFSSYYREDYKNGEVALKLLHTIICTFDNLLQKQAYVEKLEKIKTTNDCYMLASGLNTNTNTSKSQDHLVALMMYAFDLHYHLHLFNMQNIIGSYRFTLKVGYNFGPVTAGIIGITKPLYDIWGDTVNVASRMFSTALSGNIQVPDYVVTRLKPYFEFKYRGVVPIKGKGEMITYLAMRSYSRSHLCLQNFTDKPSEPPKKTSPVATKYLQELQGSGAVFPKLLNPFKNIP